MVRATENNNNNNRSRISHALNIERFDVLNSQNTNVDGKQIGYSYVRENSIFFSSFFLFFIIWPLLRQTRFELFHDT